MKIKKIITIVLFLIATILSIIFMNKVSINYNLSDYLSNDTETKTAINIIEDEFGMTGNIQVMIKNISKEDASKTVEKLENIEHVININFDKNDTTYYKNNTALLIVIVDGDDYSSNASKVITDIKKELETLEVEYGGTAIEKQSLKEAITSEMIYILAISICLVIAILLITSQSWIEPFLLLLTSFVAILINRGTNIFFKEISYITSSISAILQLALSIDYSIVLLHAYRKNKQEGLDNQMAMKNALKAVLNPISASALTTIMGLLALLFMSFKIGFDIGIVLMKGIVISAITSLTLLPMVILIFDRAMKKTSKKSFTPKGKWFCKLAIKRNKIIVLVGLIIIAICGILQTKNNYIFTDNKASNEEIVNAFGNNNTVVVLYKNSSSNYDNELKLIENIKKYKTISNKEILTNYTGYTNTVREEYDVYKVMEKFELSQNDAEMLFTMYTLYNDQSKVKMTFQEFVEFTYFLSTHDNDAKSLIDDDTLKTLTMFKNILDIYYTMFTASQLHTSINNIMNDNDSLSLLKINQLYGEYFYNELLDKEVNFMTIVNFMVSLANDEEKNIIDDTTKNEILSLKDSLVEFISQMELEMNKQMFKAYCYQNYNIILQDEEIEQIWFAYYSDKETINDTIPFLELMAFMVKNNLITDEQLIVTINEYNNLYQAINLKYDYEQFCIILSSIINTEKSNNQIQISKELIKEVYIMYFIQMGSFSDKKLDGKTFFNFAKQQDQSNQLIHNQITNQERNKIEDIILVGKLFDNKENLKYIDLYSQLQLIQDNIKSEEVKTNLSVDEVSGVYIKYAIYNNIEVEKTIMAYRLLDFISENMETNKLLKQRMTMDNKEKVNKANNDVKKATELFVGKNYSRMLLSLDLPNEGELTTNFVSNLDSEVKKIFGEDAYITGEIVSTYDLRNSFSHDNTFISIFTIVSIFIIILIVFSSLSLPIILVAIIQGAIYIAMSTQLFGDGIFFMSYIVSTCILMGSTIDYGILMSSNYVLYRQQYDKKESLEQAINLALPTVFSSGLILTVCGFVIHFISSQNSISTVGLLIGIGGITSVIMIMIVLPSVLYLLDKFVLKFSFKKKIK